MAKLMQERDNTSKIQKFQSRKHKNVTSYTTRNSIVPLIILKNKNDYIKNYLIKESANQDRIGWTVHFVFPDLPENTTPPAPKYVCDCVHVRDHNEIFILHMTVGYYLQ